jgi:hypothetical protein
MSRTRFERISVLLIVASFLFALAASGCSFSGTDSEASTPVPEYRVTFGFDPLLTDDVVQFSLINVESGEIAADRNWSISSPHNVPGGSRCHAIRRPVYGASNGSLFGNCGGADSVREDRLLR